MTSVQSGLPGQALFGDDELPAFTTFIRYLDRIRGRYTQSRLKVARWILDMAGVFDLEAVVKHVGLRDEEIGPRSVATTLELLVKSGVVYAIPGEKADHYLSLAYRKPGLLALICQDCLKIHDVAIPEAKSALERVAQSKDIVPLFSCHVLRGRCRACQNVQKEAAAAEH